MSYVFCMYISRLFSSGINIGGRRFRNLIDGGKIQGSRFPKSCIYFILSINLQIKNYIKYFMVLMPSSFYKGNKDKTSKSSVKKAILITSILFYQFQPG